MTTTDLSKFGARELAMAEELLEAQRTQGLPEDFQDSEVTVMMNTMSGNVFLTNSEFEVAMMNGDKLESFYTSPYKGTEGFFEDLIDEYKDMHPEDKEWFERINEDYYNHILPFELEDGTWIEEGENYWTIEDNEVVESVYDENTDKDETCYSSEIKAYEALATEHDFEFEKDENDVENPYTVDGSDERLTEDDFIGWVQEKFL